MLRTDAWGRLVPAVQRFPSASGGKGFKPLADYVHAKGLKFGIHVMRGIPRQVVHEDMRICGGRFRATEAANESSTCTWLNHMFGVRADTDAGRGYYESLFELYASWGVDLVKVDDILADGHFDSTGPYHAAEIEAIAAAIDKCGRPMVLSLSPGDAPKASAGHVKQFASMWRISADFWDDWRRLKRQFDLCKWWAEHRSPGHWPDADMLPLGRLSLRGPKGPERDSWFTPEEQRTMMTLWCIFQSPLMMGGALTEMDEATIALLTNDRVLDALNHGRNSAEAFRDGSFIVWTANDARDPSSRYAACFNLGDSSIQLGWKPSSVGFPDGKVEELWTGSCLEPVNGSILLNLPAHGCVFLRLR